MLVQTTINIDKSVKLVLGRAAWTSGLSRSSMIMILLRKTMMEHKKHLCHWNPVRYQARSMKQVWCRVHVTLSSRDYEYMLDLRKFCKMSVSLLVALAVELYLDSVLAEYMGRKPNITDNYPFQHYILIQEESDSVICWKIYWGCPRDLRQIITQDDT
jgi:hypothetical protein